MMRFLRLGILCLSVLFAACSGKKEDGPVAVTGVTLNKTSTSLGVGETETLQATVLPLEAANRKVAWVSSDTSVATVRDGVVSGVKVGTATITATTDEGGLKASCTVTVEKNYLLGEWKLELWSESSDIAGKVYLQFDEGQSFVMYQNINEAGYTRYSGSFVYDAGLNLLSGAYSDGVSWQRSYTVTRISLDRMKLEDSKDASDVAEYIREAIPDYVKGSAAAAPSRAAGERFL